MITAAAVAVMTLLAACGGGSTVDDDPVGDGQGGIVKVRAGYVSAIDQIGLPVALETGQFEEQGLDVELAQPFPTGVDALNALQSGSVDFVQAGTPIISAAQKGIDLVLLGNYTGSSTQRSIDRTMAVVATDKAGIDGTNLATLKGKRIGVSVGSINHLYLLGLLQKANLAATDVRIVNTAPPDMAVALQTNGIDVAIVWDPWPIVITDQVSGAKEVLRGGGYIPFIGYIVATRSFVEQNPEVVTKFLTARAGVDQWMRKNAADAAESAARWLPGTKPEVADRAMQYNVEQLDGRFSQCNYLALDTISRLLAEQDVVEADFDVNKYFEPGPILQVMQSRPELFEDLPAVPQAAAISDGYQFSRDAAMKACP
ncbi:ABC transporter substrate-binding protein [Micromonospora costi]|uniref:ABC transporter substrate-binding protein n=1 Tax=Micromonospora costi TaxID=1530042 RepID=A0A3B0A4N2_9ACTN|nr:NrtA/SsuA/CpmA family ABC transporter substrate-binding protein [Micromonospora costi]RKN55410.1 ABC transporter substrate-binding protein [Micromonospora costi]